MKLFIFLVIILSLICADNLHSQDRIIFLNGDTMHVKVTDRNDFSISYKTSSKTDTVYSISTAQVKKIFYRIGYEYFVMRHIPRDFVPPDYFTSEILYERKKLFL